MYSFVVCLFNFFLSSPEEMLIDFGERGREGERERDIDRLPLIHAPIRTELTT